MLYIVTDRAMSMS